MSRSALAPRPAAAWLDDLDGRLRVLVAVATAVAVLSLRHWPLPLLVVLLYLSLALLGGQARRPLLLRLLAFEGFMLVLLVLLPFSVPGDPWLNIGPWVATEQGALQALLIVLKANAIVLALLTLVGSMEPTRLGPVLGQLGVPDKLVHLLLFTVRYVVVLEQEYRRLRQAMRARAFVVRSDWHTWRSLGWLLGMLLIRSMERSHRVLQAMRCRGFADRLFLLRCEQWRRTDSVGLAFFGAAIGSILWLDQVLA